jgi:site-specific DNA-methyltransferase (adenine-specific)
MVCYRVTLQELPGGGDDAPPGRRLVRVLKYSERVAGLRCLRVEGLTEEDTLAATDEHFWVVLAQDAEPFWWTRKQIASWIKQNRLAPHAVQVCPEGGAWGVAADFGFTGDPPPPPLPMEGFADLREGPGVAQDSTGGEGAAVTSVRDVTLLGANEEVEEDTRSLVPRQPSAFLTTLPTDTVQHVLGLPKPSRLDQAAWDRRMRAYAGELARRGVALPPQTVGAAEGPGPPPAAADAPAGQATPLLADGQFWRVDQADCLEWLPTLPAGCAALIYADPPFNIGLEYRGYRDRLPRDRYLAWTREWLAAARRVLSPTGSLLVQIDDGWAGYVQTALDSMGLYRRNTIVWFYRFGVYTEKKYGRNHQLILYYVADPKRFTFNADAVRVPSDRQTKYGDKRAGGKAKKDGRVPGDVWEFPRVAGTFKRRVNHACQTPDELLDRVVLACSNPGDLLVDPFAGSGSAGAAALRHGRRYLGCELSAETAEEARGRLAKLTQHRLATQPTEAAL